MDIKWLKRIRKRVSTGNEFNRRFVNIFGVERVFEITLITRVSDVPKCYVGFYLDEEEEIKVLELLEDSKWKEIRDELSKYSSTETN